MWLMIVAFKIAVRICERHKAPFVIVIERISQSVRELSRNAFSYIRRLAGGGFSVASLYTNYAPRED